MGASSCLRSLSGTAVWQGLCSVCLAGPEQGGLPLAQPGILRTQLADGKGWGFSIPQSRSPFLAVTHIHGYMS